MSGKIERFVALAVIAIVASACAKEPPKCSDEATFSLIRQIIMEQIGGIEGASQAEIIAQLQFAFARPTGFDEKVKKYSCETKLTAGGAYELPLSYESQLDDKHQHIVSVDGIATGDLRIVRHGVAEAIEKSRQPKATTIAPAQPAPAPMEQPAHPAVIDAKTPVEPAPATALQQEPLAPMPSASFNCAKASGSVETSICTNATLGKLDGALAANYKSMMASDIGDGPRADLKASQRAWIGSRNKCTDTKCLEDAYRQRVDQVCEYPVISGVHPGCIDSADIK